MSNKIPVGSEPLPPAVSWLDRVKGWSADHPVLSVIVVAALARGGAVLVTTLVPRGTFALDDGTYMDLARALASGNLSGWGTYEHQLSDQTLTFLWPLKTLFQLLGTHYVVGQIYVSLWGIAAAALTTLIALRFLPQPAAIGAGLVVALLPSEVLWSSLVLKDAAVWATLTLLALLCLNVNHADSRRLPLIAVALVAVLFGLAFLRHHTLVVAVWSLPVALWFGRPSLRTARIVGGITLALIIPMSVGLGVGGWKIATDPDLADRRVANARGAESAFIEPDEDGIPGQPGGDERPGSTTTSGDGENETSGGHAKRPPPDDSVSDNIKHLPRGLTVMLFEPVPWRQSTSSNVTFARWEMVLWYPLLMLAVVGIRFAGRHLRELAFPLLVGVGMLLVYALAEGNIGTAYRHRGEFVWVVALLAALGAHELARRWRDRERPDEEAADTVEPHAGQMANREKGPGT